MDYDAWILRGPEEHEDPEMETCGTCDMKGVCVDLAGEYECPDCNGTGLIEVVLGEYHGDDCDFESRRDADLEGN